MTARLTAAALAVAFLAAPDARAEFVVTFNFAGLTGETASVPATVTGAPGVTAADLIRGPGLGVEDATNAFNARGFTTADALDPADFFQFVVNPGATPLNFGELAFTARRSAAGPRALEVRASTDDFATSTPLALQALSDATENFRLTIGLGAPELQGVTGPVTFRIFGFGAEAAVGTLRLGVDNGDANANLPANLIVRGQVVPEPASVVLAGVGLVVALGVARRRARAA